VSWFVTAMGSRAMEDGNKRMEDYKKRKRRGLRLWIDPALLPTRLAQRVREQQHPANRWIRKGDTAVEGRYLKLADEAFKDTGNSNKREQEPLLTPLL